MAEQTLDNEFLNAGDPPAGSSAFLTDFNQSVSNMVAAQTPPEKPLSISERLNAPVGPKYALPVSDDQINLYRYQDGFKEESFNPFDGTNYQKFADKETWGTALSKGFDSFGYKFGNTFADYWAGYGRMADALLSWDWSKMRPDEATMADQYYNDQKDMFKNFVFEQPDSEDSLISKRTVSELIGNTGFALGTFAGLGIEIAADVAVTALTGGAGAVSFLGTAARVLGKEAVEQGVKTAAKKAFSFSDALSDIGKGFTMANRSEDEFTAAAKIINQMDEASKLANPTASASRTAINATFDVFSNNILNVAKSKTFAEGAANFAKSIPVLGTGVRYAEKLGIAAKAGASGGQLLGIGLQGVRRVAQELNMSATEASFEAVTSYGDTLDKQVQEYKNAHNGEPPSSEEFERMKSLASKASASNYNTNMAILLATNKLQFGNVMNKFFPANKYMLDVADNILVVEGKAGSAIYRKGMMGTLGVAGEIAKDFGKKEAAFQLGKSFLRNTALKFSISEGIQENLQETSAAGWRDYYASQFEGTGLSLQNAFGNALDEQFTKQGLKTFLMGAVTGTLISGPTRLAGVAIEQAQRASVNREYKDNPDMNPLKQQEAKLDEDLKLINAALKQTNNKKFESRLVNFNAQMDAAQQQADAAASGNRYEFENGKDNALLAAVVAAKNTNTQDVLYRAVRDMGVDMTNDEFKASFGFTPEDVGFGSAAEFTQDVATKIKKYSDTLEGLTNGLKSRLANPSDYAPGSRSQYAAYETRKVQDDAIQIIAMNQMKGTMSAERAKKVAQDLLSVPGMSSSADYAIRVLTTPKFLQGEIGNVEGEIRVLKEQLSQEGIDADTKAELKEQLQDKYQERKLLNDWSGYWQSRKDVVGETEEGDEVVRDTIDEVFSGKKIKDGEGYNQADQEVIETFRKLVNIKNKQAGISTEIQEQFIQQGFEKVLDYINLDRDTKDYMRSVDVLMNPDNYRNAVERMVDGKFKHNLLLYVDNIMANTYLRAQLKVEELGITNQADQVDFIQTVMSEVMESDAFKNMVTLISNPDVTIEQEDYAFKLSEQITQLTKDSIDKMVAKYAPEASTGDISQEELDDIIENEKLDTARRVLLANKLGNGITLSPREQKVYEMFRAEIDQEVEQQKATAPKPPVTQPVNQATAPSEDDMGVEGEEETAVFVGDPNQTDWNGLVQNAASTRELDAIMDQADQAGATTPELVDAIAQKRAEFGATPEENLDDQTNVLANFMGQPEAPAQPTPEETPQDEIAGLEGDVAAGNNTLLDFLNQSEDQFNVTGTSEEGFTVVDKTGTVVTATRDSEAEAQERADSLNQTYNDLEFVTQFLSGQRPDVKELRLASKVRLTDRLVRSMKSYNSRKKTMFTSLEEYYRTPDGKRLINAIVESEVSGKPVDYKTKKPAVTTQSTAVSQPTLFATTSTQGTTPAVTLESMQKLYTQALQLRDQVLQNSEKNGKFVEEGQIIDELREITSCFS